jgi:ribosomal protein S18 acetylase RimI-like enzyme
MFPPRRLSDPDLAALDDLERRVVAVDGGRLKLEKAVLREGRAQGLLSYDGDRLVGFLGIYVFGSVPELAGAVDPDFRRRGLGTALLDSALRVAPAGPVLLVVPAGSVGGEAVARSRGGRHDHAEHALVLTVAPEGAPDPRNVIRPARREDADEVARLLAAAFGHPFDVLSSDTLVVEHEGLLVGTLRRKRDGDTAGIYGFAVDPSRQGEGIGRDVLRRVCREALAGGATRVALEVAVDNPHALRLYTSTGFEPVAGEDYWSLPGAGPAAPTP